MTTRRFNELNITIETKAFKGDKIRIERILNQEIEVHDFKVEPSKYPKQNSATCLHLQIKYKDEFKVVFSGSNYLQRALLQMLPEHFPFRTKIVEGEFRRLDFT